MENEEFQSPQQLSVNPPPATPVETCDDFQQAPVMKVKDWLIIYLIMIIPIVNIVMLFIWAFDKNINPNKSNWAKASLVWTAIGLILYILFLAAFWSSITDLMQSAAGVSVY
jgi:hypothetical protein